TNECEAELQKLLSVPPIEGTQVPQDGGTQVHAPGGTQVHAVGGTQVPPIGGTHIHGELQGDKQGEQQGDCVLPNAKYSFAHFSGECFGGEIPVKKEKPAATFVDDVSSGSGTKAVNK